MKLLSQLSLEQNLLKAKALKEKNELLLIGVLANTCQTHLEIDLDSAQANLWPRGDMYIVVASLQAG